ncbi:DUF4394 domain-containing protein [Oscillatoria sp. FACHB-1407]|uniref:DUF4394 domain-containing protein n=1 Tax=Oscillatoria sp. FACHB-1407 TaxID=2692847 RepID=UPI0016854800|nr:DUF4394 domain-containing protein [Oscillatoria sp. FACHB-1407]MBD2460442.1 DUF4394 domain-containing protein [Oscillatoria sp. FACHB-1407]
MTDAGNRFSDASDIRFRNGRFVVRESLAEFDKLDFYRIRLTARSNFTCLISGLEGNADLALYDSRGREIVSSEEDDDDNESISRQLAAGTYFVRVNRIEGDTNYRFVCSVSQDAGNSFSRAFRIRTGKNKLKGSFVFNDSIGSFGDDDDDGDDDNGGDRFDFYRFDLTSRSNCTTLLQGLSSNANITIFNSRRQRIAFSARGGNLSEQINQILEAGTYFIRIDFGRGGGGGGGTRYRLRINFQSLLISTDDDDTTTARPINITPSTDDFDDFVGVGDPEDFYRVNLNSPTNLNLALNGLSADANLELLNSTGTVIGRSSNTGTTEDLINQSLTAGTYFVRVFPAATNTSVEYTLNFASAPLRLFGLTDNNAVVAFNPDKLDKAVNINVTGLASGETLRGIDFRPATGELFGISSANKLYTINLASGAATAVSNTAFTPALTGTSLGIDFNPTVDRIRVVSDLDENARLNPITGAIVDFDTATTGTQTDTALAYATDDTRFGTNPNVTAVAYTNNFAGTATTTLFGIDTSLDVLVRQGSADGTPVSPNTGSLFSVGALGVDFGPNSGFDIFTDASGVNTAYATSGSTLYSINLTTGVATSLGTVTVSTTPTTGTGTTPGTTPAPLNLIGLSART